MIMLHGTFDGSVPSLPGYDIVRELQKGGMGRIFLARQQALNRVVCVKVLRDNPAEELGKANARFCREAELLASVTHPHVLSIFDFGMTVDSRQPFLVTEYVEGGDLRRQMRPGQPMDMRRVRMILAQVGDALAFLHQRGILHRDMKPENILMHSPTHVKIADFGIAVLQEDVGTLTQTTRGMGTLGYVSPEQQVGAKVDERSDQYGLAALAYELLTGRRVLGKLPAPSEVNPKLSRDADRIILKGLSDSPGNRYPHVKDFIDALNQALAVSPRWCSKHLLGSLLASLILGAWIGSLALVHYMRRSEKPLSKAAAIDSPLARAGSQAEPQQNVSGAFKTLLNTRSEEFRKLVELRAYRLWLDQGSPEGERGDRVKIPNWLRAESEISKEVDALAYKFWEKQGRPTGQAGHEASDRNRMQAEFELLRQAEKPGSTKSAK